MNGKRARKIRKLLNLKLPIKPDMRILNQTEKYVYFPSVVSEKPEMVKVTRTSVINAAKHRYNSAKKQLKGHKIPNIGKQDLEQEVATSITEEEISE